MTTQAGTSDFPVSVALGGGRRQEVRIGRHTTWTQFRQRVHQAFGLPAGVVTYTDEEGDKIALDSEEEFREAVKVGLKLGRLKLNIADTKPKASRGHYADLSRTLGDERKAAAQQQQEPATPSSTFTDSPVQPTQPQPNPYIAHFVRSMSQKQSADDVNDSDPQSPPQATYADSAGSQPPPVTYVVNSPAFEGAAVKRRRVNVSDRTSGGPVTSKGYRRAFRPTAQPYSTTAVPVEGVRQNLEAMKISPGAPRENPYVEKLELALKQCYKCGPPRPPATPHNEEGLPQHFSNQYIVGYHQKLLKTRRVCQASRPNCYVAHIQQRFARDYHKLGSRASSSPASTPATGKTFFNQYADQVARRIHHHYQTGDHTDSRKALPTCTLPASTGPIHCGVKCDGCDSDIVGVRYKCGNCADYDLCEHCEPSSDLIHPPDHMFLNVKVPCSWLGRDSSGAMRPLLPYTIYACQEISEDQVPLLKSEGGGVAMIVRPKDKLREEIKAAKRRRREEKLRRKDGKLDPRKLEAKLEKLQSKRDHSGRTEREEIVLPPVTFQGPKAASCTHGHKKYLDCKVVTDTCYPQGSSVPSGIDFEKGWILKNSGTKKWKHARLVHQGGYRPCRSEVAIPEVKPGDSVEIRVQYPAVTVEDTQFVQSSWQLIHKESTAFGPTLTVSVIVENPVAVSSTPSLPHPSPPTNEDLLKSIGFLPSEKMESEMSAPPDFLPSYPTDFDTAPNDGEPGQFSSGDPQEGSASGDVEGTASDQLLHAFEMVENPCSSVISLSSTDSLHQTAPPAHSEGAMETDSLSGSEADSDDEFVVVIPDCFNLDLPLSGNAPLPSHDAMTRSCDLSLDIDPTAGPCDQFTVSHDVMTQSHESVMTPTHTEPITHQPLPSASEDSIPRPKPEPQAPPTSGPPKTASPGTSPRAGRRGFVPEPVTLRGVKDARLINPLTVATGLVNTVANLVEGLSFPGKRNSREGEREVRGEGRREEPMASDEGQGNGEQQQTEEEEEAFVDCPQFPEPSAPSLTPPPYSESPPPPSYPWQQCLPDDVTSWLQRDVSRYVHSESQEDVQGLLQRQWSGPPLPDDPVDKLVAMGFANRELNRQLLQKHNNQLQSVTNELLDRQNSGGDSHWASSRH